MNKVIFEVETEEIYSKDDIKSIHEIFTALIKTGGLLGMKNGSTNIHFDKDANFMGIRFDYWPYRRRKAE